MGGVDSTIALTHDKTLPPSTYAQPIAGKDVWFEKLIGVFGMMGAMAAVAALVFGIYVFIDKRNRRAAEDLARHNDEEEGIDMPAIDAHPLSAMVERPGSPVGGRIVNLHDVVGSDNPTADIVRDAASGIANFAAATSPPHSGEIEQGAMTASDGLEDGGSDQNAGNVNHTFFANGLDVTEVGMPKMSQMESASM